MKVRRKCIFIIGAPGTGKTTLMRTLIDYLKEKAYVRKRGSEETLVKFLQFNFAEEGNLRPWRVIGVYPETQETYAEGTDKLSMGVQPAFMRFLTTNPSHLLIEGDRLANVKTFTALKREGYDVTVYTLHVSDAFLQQRYEERGSNQSPTFLKSRHTKIRNLVKALDEIGIRNLQQDGKKLKTSADIRRSIIDLIGLRNET